MGRCLRYWNFFHAIFLFHAAVPTSTTVANNLNNALHRSRKHWTIDDTTANLAHDASPTPAVILNTATSPLHKIHGPATHSSIAAGTAPVPAHSPDSRHLDVAAPVSKHAHATRRHSRASIVLCSILLVIVVIIVLSGVAWAFYAHFASRRSPQNDRSRFNHASNGHTGSMDEEDDMRHQRSSSRRQQRQAPPRIKSAFKSSMSDPYSHGSSGPSAGQRSGGSTSGHQQGTSFVGGSGMSSCSDEGRSSWPGPTITGLPLCPLLVVPDGTRFACVVQNDVRGCRQELSFDISAVAGRGHAPLFRVRVAELESDVSGHDGPGISVETLDGNKQFAYLSTAELWNQIQSPRPGQSPRPSMTSLGISRSQGTPYGTLQKADAGEYLVLRGGAKMLSFTGDFRNHVIHVTGPNGRTLAATMQNSAEEYQVHMHAGADAGLVILALLAIDKLELASSGAGTMQSSLSDGIRSSSETHVDRRNSTDDGSLTPC